MGVVLNLALWFALHVLFAVVDERDWHVVRLYVPEIASLDWAALALSALTCFVALRPPKV